MTHSISKAMLALAFASSWAIPAMAQSQGPAEAQTQPSTASSGSGASSVPAAAAPSEWSIKPRGRLQFDFGTIGGTTLDLPANQAQLGPDTRIRRAYLGVDITIPGGFGARFETDFAADPITLTDAYVFYKPNKDLTITAGHHKPFWGLEEMTSDNFTTFRSDPMDSNHRAGRRDRRTA